MSRMRILVALTVSSLPAHSFAAGVDAAVIIPLYAVLFVLSVFSFGKIDTPTKSIALALICGIMLLLNFVFSVQIYLEWLAKALDSLVVALLFAAFSPFLIVHLTNLITRRTK